MPNTRARHTCMPNTRACPIHVPNTHAQPVTGHAVVPAGFRTNQISPAGSVTKTPLFLFLVVEMEFCVNLQGGLKTETADTTKNQFLPDSTTTPPRNQCSFAVYRRNVTLDTATGVAIRRGPMIPRLLSREKKVSCFTCQNHCVINLVQMPRKRWAEKTSRNIQLGMSRAYRLPSLSKQEFLTYS